MRRKKKRLLCYLLEGPVQMVKTSIILASGEQISNLAQPQPWILKFIQNILDNERIT